ncbi:MAG: response regulator [Acetobacteraceae bacterium]|nr:response regulator [Acetobacteraceae bacterium]
MLADLAQLREPLADLVDSAIALQRLEIIRRTREVRGADRIALAALSIAGLAGACLVLLLLRAPTAMGTAQPAGPPAPAVDPLLVAQAGSDVVAALHRTVGRLGLLVAADGATAEPLRSSRESAEAALAAAELMAEAAVLLAGRRSAQSMPFDAERVLRDALAEGAHAPALVQAAAGTPRLWRGDPLRFAALARALAAAAATPGTRSLSVLLARDPGGLAVTFGDGLQGPFELLDPGDTVPGLGAAALMVRALGGQLLRVRPAAGRAERLRLVLPFVPVAEADAGGTQGGRALRVLAVDDVPANRRLLAALLERHGHRCETAADAEAALARLSAGGIDVVLLDVHMPGIDGEAAARLIRSLPPPAGRVPIVAVTAQVAAEERAALLATGIVDVIEKPITSAELLSALSRAVGRPVGAASSAAPLTDRVAVSVLRSTLSAEDFARFVSDRLEMAAEALAQVEAAMAEQDRARAEAALDRLRAAFEPFGASRLAEVVAGFRRGEADLVDLRRTVEETSRALARGSPTPART